MVGLALPAGTSHWIHIYALWAGSAHRSPGTTAPAVSPRADESRTEQA